jgi:hypothetical protein
MTGAFAAPISSGVTGSGRVTGVERVDGAQQ